ncbi:hypothetical protein E2C01_096988 [Portunus trituberculatus]|uniref:Uncharacterized protein n=1 Tax=Portunus trituberculatus TaxID=210409 RepID=A0A5B7K8B4_PORTR|nr:hypothetical protein [Portunus trituberculatus]
MDLKISLYKLSLDHFTKLWGERSSQGVNGNLNVNAPNSQNFLKAIPLLDWTRTWRGEQNNRHSEHTTVIIFKCSACSPRFPHVPENIRRIPRLHSTTSLFAGFCWAPSVHCIRSHQNVQVKTHPYPHRILRKKEKKKRKKRM